MKAEDGAPVSGVQPALGCLKRRWDPRAAQAARRGVAASRDFFQSDGLWVLVALTVALIVRLRYVGHPIAWDEANVLVALREAVERGGLDLYWQIHAPLYLVALLPVAYLAGATPVAMSLVGIGFSLVLIWLVWLLAREIFDRDTAVLAAFALAAMPINAVFSTWVKQDALMSALIVGAVLLFVRGRWLLAALPLALAIFTKEYALLAIPAVLAWTVLTFQWDRVWRWLLASTLAAAGSLWYFLAFGTTGGQFIEGFVGVGKEYEYFGQPWYYYLLQAPRDFGWPVLLVALAGVGYALWRWHRDDLAYALVLCWAAVVYVAHSVGGVKGQWYLYQATPVVAILAGVGGAWILRLVRSESRRAKLAAVLPLLMVLPVADLSYRAYTENRSFFSSYVTARNVGLAVREHVGPNDLVALAARADPILVYYSGLPRDRFVTSVETVDRAEMLRSYGRHVPYSGEASEFLRLARTGRWRWLSLPGYGRFPAEYAVARKIGRIVFDQGEWALVDFGRLRE